MAQYEFLVHEKFTAVGIYAVNASTRAEALQKVHDHDPDVFTLGDPELIPARPMTVRDVTRGPRVREAGESRG